MSIERDATILIEPEGNLRATTSWISKHDEGLAELLKNVHYAYLPNRANVAPKHHIAAILFADADDSGPARVGVLDVGGATVDDLQRWSVWQDQRASLVDGVTQGNGGKAYLFRLFTGKLVCWAFVKVSAIAKALKVLRKRKNAERPGSCRA
jgi:hypothetical protein